MNKDFKEQILKHFQCQRSGNCCRYEGYVYVTQEEMIKMAEKLELPISEFKEKFVLEENGWQLIAKPGFRKNCFLDKNNNCQVYEARPKKCRTYPDWPEIFQSEETLKKETELCPGLRKAYEIYQNSHLSCD